MAAESFTGKIHRYFKGIAQNGSAEARPYNNAKAGNFDKALTVYAMAIVHHVGESLGASVDLRQKTNDSNTDFVIAKIMEFIKTSAIR